MKELTVNDRLYSLPSNPMVVICLDGCEPAYLEKAAAAGKTPALSRIRQEGTDRIAHSVIPSFTNPNNMSIATGRPPEVHGICGNYLYNPANGEAVMMNDPSFLRAPTIFKGYYDAGARVAIVTAKDKLRTLLGHGLRFDEERAVCFSSERSGETTLSEHGLEKAANWLDRAVPDVYSAELSEFVFAAGVKLLEEFKPDVMYLTTTDYIQHKYAPEDDEAIAFYAMFDKYLQELDALGASIVITADHGMKPKHLSDGSPAVVYLQDYMNEWLGEGSSKVILPITDPYVVHHGALGSYATAYIEKSEADTGVAIADLLSRIEALEGIDVVLTRDHACERFGLPPDRLGDLVIISGENVTIGTSAVEHDLSGLDAPLRSHGGLTEQAVPFICNRVMADMPAAPELRNYDAFFLASQAATQSNV